VQFSLTRKNEKERSVEVPVADWCRYNWLLYVLEDKQLDNGGRNSKFTLARGGDLVLAKMNRYAGLCVATTDDVLHNGLCICEPQSP
jgi:hypothetical protein